MSTLLSCATPMHRHDHRDAKHWMEVLEDPAREAAQKPAEVVAVMEITEGMTVADVGAGTGYFEPHLGRAVGDAGRVLALDVDAELVAHMRERFKAAANVEVRLVAADDPGLEPRSVDRILIVDVWHHLAGRVAYAKKLGAALKPGGRLVIVDYLVDAPTGPPREMRMSAAAIIDELKASGFDAREVPETLPNQFIVVAEPGYGR